MNAATTPGHTCGWSVGQGNDAVDMLMIRLRYMGGTILLEPLEVINDLSLSTKCSSFFIVTDRSLSSSNQNGPMMPCLEMATHAVYWQGVMAFADSIQGMYYPGRS